MRLRSASRISPSNDTPPTSDAGHTTTIAITESERGSTATGAPPPARPNRTNRAACNTCTSEHRVLTESNLDAISTVSGERPS